VGSNARSPRNHACLTAGNASTGLRTSWRRRKQARDRKTILHSLWYRDILRLVTYIRSHREYSILMQIEPPTTHQKHSPVWLSSRDSYWMSFAAFALSLGGVVPLLGLPCAAGALALGIEVFRSDRGAKFFAVLAILIGTLGLFAQILLLMGVAGP
jgi:hypothetical protein